jgi:ribulose 1,5-bisphosphate carboxylase large subunit-like protein
MNIDRMQRLITVMEAVVADENKSKMFDIAVYSNETPDCGTHYCMCGWAAIDPVLSEEGLGLQHYAHRSNKGILTYQGSQGLHAAGAFFGIRFSGAEYLFLPSSYPTDLREGPTGAAYALERLKTFVAANGVPVS